jgi:hypothetical protein
MSAVEIMQKVKPWEARQLNKLIERIDREQNRPNPEETIYEKVERLQRTAETTRSMTAHWDLNLAWLEAEKAGLAHVPTTEESFFNGAKPYWLDHTGPLIDNTPTTPLVPNIPDKTVATKDQLVAFLVRRKRFSRYDAERRVGDMIEAGDIPLVDREHGLYNPKPLLDARPV